MRLWIPEIDQHPVAYIFGNKAGEAADRHGDIPMISADHLPQVFGVEPSGKRRRADEIAEHNRKLPALCRRPAFVGGRRYRTALAAQRGDCCEQFASVPDEADTQVLEIVGGQLRQYCGIDRVVAKRLFVLLHAEALKPGGDVHTRLPAAINSASVYLTQIAARALGISVADRRPRSRCASSNESRGIPSNAQILCHHHTRPDPDPVRASL